MKRKTTWEVLNPKNKQMLNVKQGLLPFSMMRNPAQERVPFAMQRFKKNILGRVKNLIPTRKINRYKKMSLPRSIRTIGGRIRR